MRLDLVLKLSGIIKRRTVAKALSDNGKILVNGRPSKPSTEVKNGDHLIMSLGTKKIEVEITFIEKYKKEFPTFVEINKEDLDA